MAEPWASEELGHSVKMIVLFGSNYPVTGVRFLKPEAVHGQEYMDLIYLQ